MRPIDAVTWTGNGVRIRTSGSKISSIVSAMASPGSRKGELVLFHPVVTDEGFST